MPHIPGDRAEITGVVVGIDDELSVDTHVVLAANLKRFLIGAGIGSLVELFELAVTKRLQADHDHLETSTSPEANQVGMLGDRRGMAVHGELLVDSPCQDQLSEPLHAFGIGE